MAVEPVVLDNDILAFYEAGLAEALTKFRSEISVSASGIDERNYRHCLLLRRAATDHAAAERLDVMNSRRLICQPRGSGQAS